MKSPGDFDALLRRIEAAIDAHPLLKRDPFSDPVFRISRLGVTAEVRVKRIGSRKKPTGITGTGDTVEEATNHLIDGLDIWAEVLS